MRIVGRALGAIVLVAIAASAVASCAMPPASDGPATRDTAWGLRRLGLGGDGRQGELEALGR